MLVNKEYVDNIVENAPYPLTPQWVNLAKVDANGQADFIGSGTGLKPSINANTTNLIGNGQNMDKISKFSFTTDFNLPDNAPTNRRSSIVYKNWSTTPVFDYACQRQQWGNTFDSSKNLLVVFNNNIANDYYSNTISLLDQQC